MTDPDRTLVLVADDEPSTLALVSGHMRSKGYDVLEAADGDEAWELAREHLPDLVVLDVMMPGMSGWEVCRKIRETVSLAHTGVVMLTGIGENLNEMTSPLYGADAHVDKPFEFSALDASVRKTLTRRRSEKRDANEGVSTSAPPSADDLWSQPTPAPPPPEEVSSDDVSDALARVLGDGARAPRKAKAKPARKAAKSAAKKVTAKKARKSATKPAKAAKPAEKAAAKPAKKAAKPAKKSAAKPAKKAATKKVAKVAQKPAKKAAKPARKSAAKPAKKAATKKVAKVAQKPAKKAAVKPAKKAAVKPAKKAAKPAKKEAKPAKKEAKPAKKEAKPAKKEAKRANAPKIRRS